MSLKYAALYAPPGTTVRNSKLHPSQLRAQLQAPRAPLHLRYQYPLELIFINLREKSPRLLPTMKICATPSEFTTLSLQLYRARPETVRLQLQIQNYLREFVNLQLD